MEEVPIIYLSSGKLGDFMHQLSVVNEFYIKTGKRGIIYLENQFFFEQTLLKTFSDLYPIIKKQIYIKDFYIYNNQKYDIDLKQWRNNPLLYKDSWFKIFNSTYQIDSWGKNKWINLEYIEKYNNCILICNSPRRINYNFMNNVNKLFKKTDKKVLFTCTDKSEYQTFKQLSNFDCEFEIFNSLNDWWNAISSCYLFIGNISSPLCVAYACHKMNIAILSEGKEEIDNNFFYKLTDEVSDKYQWYLSDKKYSSKVPEYLNV